MTLNNSADDFLQEQHAYYRSQIRYGLWMGAVGSSLCVIVLAVYAFWNFDLRNRVFYVESDKLIPKETFLAGNDQKWTTPVLRRELANFVIKLRSLPSDRHIMSENFKWLFARIPQSAPAYKRLQGFLANDATGPATLQTSYIRRVEVETVNFQGGNTWIVEWREKTHPRGEPDNQVITVLQGRFEITPVEARNLDAIPLNPTGVGVREYSLTRIGEQNGG
jgi:type IV secretory pathway TrbF-like protein